MVNIQNLKGSLLKNVRVILFSTSFPYLCIVKHLKHHKLYVKSDKSKAISK